MIRNLISGCLILKFEHSFLNNFDFPVFFEKFLSAVCFRDLFAIRIINYLRAFDGPVSFNNGFSCNYGFVSEVLVLRVASGILSAMFFISSSWFLLRPYDVTATFCSFVHAISTELHVWCHFLLLVEQVFLFMRVIKFLVTLDLPHSQKWLPQFEIDFYIL